MNLFGIGGWELLLILVIMLVVAGPKRMLQWAYLAGRVLAQVRVMWGQVMDTVQSELDDAGVDFKVPKELSRNEMNRAARDFIKPFEDEYRQAESEYKKEVKALDASIKTAGEDKPKELTSGTPPAAATVNGTAKPGNKPTITPPPTNKTGFGTWSGTKPPAEGGNGPLANGRSTDVPSVDDTSKDEE